MNDTPEAQAKQDRAHLLIALRSIQEAHNLLSCGHPNPFEARHVLAVRAASITDYLKGQEPQLIGSVDYDWDIDRPEGIEEVAG